MISQSERVQKEEAVRNTQGLGPIQDDSPVVARPDSEIHTNIDDPEESDRHRENEPAIVDPVENTTDPNNHNPVDDVPPQHQPSPTSTSFSAFLGEVEWGAPDMMRRGGLEQIKPEKNSGRSVRFAFLPFLKPRRALTHWLMTEKGMVSRICLKQDNLPGYCCSKLKEKGEYRVIALAIEYTNAGSKGNYPREYEGPIEWRIGYVILSHSDFRAVSELPEQGAAVTDYDFSMTTWGNRCEFRVKPGKALWRLEPTLANAVREAAWPFIRDAGWGLFKKLGERTTLDEWKALLDGTTDPFLNDVEELSTFDELMASSTA